MMIYTPLINGSSFETFKAKMIDYAVGSSAMTENYFIPQKTMYAKKLKSKLSHRKVSIVLDFEGTDINDSTTQLSNLINTLIQGADILLPDGFYYKVWFDGHSVPEKMSSWILGAEISLSGFRHGQEEEINISETTDVLIKGNYESEPIIEITTTQSSVTVLGITITNAVGTTIIDSTTGKVSKGGINKFKDTSLISFPKLYPGNQSIEIIGQADVKITYLPVFV